MMPRWQELLISGSFSAVLIVMVVGSSIAVFYAVKEYGPFGLVAAVLPLFAFAVLTMWGGEFITHLMGQKD